MSIRAIVTRGFGNGTYSPAINLVTTRGYSLGIPITGSGCWSAGQNHSPKFSEGSTYTLGFIKGGEFQPAFKKGGNYSLGFNNGDESSPGFKTGEGVC